MGELRLGLLPNIKQFTLLVAINAFVGALVGFYSLVALIGEQEFGIVSKTLILSYVMAFGVTKAFCNLYAGKLADRWGRRNILLAGWLIGVPVPIIIILAPSWWWIVAANVLLAVNQGLAWSMTVIMKIDLAGPARRGLAMGLNEFAGYSSVSVTLWISGYTAGLYALRPEPFYLGLVFTLLGLGLSLLARETRSHALLEAELRRSATGAGTATVWPSIASTLPRSVFLFTTLREPALSSACFAGLVNNLIFGMSWGIIPLFYAAHGLQVATINFIKAFYPGVWGVAQLITGPSSDRLGRKWLIVTGQLMQACGLWLTVASGDRVLWILASGLLGIGTALVYPSLLAAVSDVAHPEWRGAALGTYRFWRDMGYAVGAGLSGILADVFGLSFSINAVGWLALISAALVTVRMYETHGRAKEAPAIDLRARKPVGRGPQ